MSATYDSIFVSSVFDRPSWTEAPEDREAAIENFGFTERQARFLVAVMLHGGVCVERQYCKFAGIAHGQKTHDFFLLKALMRRTAARRTPALVQDAEVPVTDQCRPSNVWREGHH